MKVSCQLFAIAGAVRERQLMTIPYTGEGRMELETHEGQTTGTLDCYFVS